MVQVCHRPSVRPSVLGLLGFQRGKCMLDIVVLSVDRLASDSVHWRASHSWTTDLGREWLKALGLFGIPQPLLQTKPFKMTFHFH